MALSGVGGSLQPFQELSHSVSITGLSRNDSSDDSFEGFPDSSTDPESALSLQRIRLLSPTASVSLEVPPQG